jgi:hypothetical protein
VLVRVIMHFILLFFFFFFFCVCSTTSVSSTPISTCLKDSLSHEGAMVEETTALHCNEM